MRIHSLKVMKKKVTVLGQNCLLITPCCFSLQETLTFQNSLKLIFLSYKLLCLKLIYFYSISKSTQRPAEKSLDTCKYAL